jgi:hypothetical protein
MPFPIRPTFSEEAMHIQIVAAFGELLRDDVVWHHSPNESGPVGRNKRAAQAWMAKRARMGVRKGWPDLEFVHAATYVVRVEPNEVDPEEFERAVEAIQNHLRGGVQPIRIPTIFECQPATCYIELKYGKNGLTKSQRETRDLLVAAGAPYAVCRSERETFEQLEEWGLLKPGAGWVLL